MSIFQSKRRILAGVPHIETESGSVVSFDKAEYSPLKQLLVGFEPVQDLHGQSSPYPAGGGKNKFDQDTVYASFKQSDGSFIGTAGNVSNTHFNIPQSLVGTELTFSMQIKIPSGSSLNNAKVAVKVNGTTTYGNNVSSATYAVSKITFTPTSTDDFVYTSFGTGSTENMQFGDVQLEVGSTATAYAPYSNICPITGWTGVNVYRTSKNLLPYDLQWYSTNPAMFDRAVHLPTGNYTLSFGSTTATTWRWYVVSYSNEGVRLLDGDELNGYSSFSWRADTQAYLSSANLNTKVATFTVLKEGNYAFGIRYGDGSSSTTFSDCQLELGSTATAYEPYKGNTFEVVFPNVNLWNSTLTIGEGYLSTNGNYSTSLGNSYASSPDKVTVEENTSYCIGLPDITANLSVVVHCFDANSNWLGSPTTLAINAGVKYAIFTTPANAKYVGIVLYRSAGYSEGELARCYVNYPSSDTTYHAHTDTTHYGGSIDVATGTFTITHGYVDLGTINYLASTTRTSGYSRFTSANLTPVAKGVLSSEIANVYCTIYTAKSADDIYSRNNGIGITASSGNITIYDEQYAQGTAADFKSAMSGVYACYELATPVTIQLTPTQVKSLRGKNNVWTDMNAPTDVSAWVH